MPIFPFTFDDEERRRRLYEGALSPGLPQGGRGRAIPMGVTPISPEDTPSPVRLPDIPTPTRMLPPPSSGIPGEIPDGSMLGMSDPSPLPESSGPRGTMLPSPGIPGGEKYGIPGIRASRPQTRYDELAEMKGAYMSGTPGRGKSALTNALRGALVGLASGHGLGGALGGAAAGGLFGGINPRGAREMEFERRERPQILERFAFEDQDRARARQAEKDALDEEYRRAQIGELGSRSKIAQENARRQSTVAQSQVDLNNARAEAARTGNPSYVDIDEGGKITKYQVFPNGMMRPVGASGAAALSRANIKSREGIAARREAGANARAARREAGKGSKKVATIDDIDAAVKDSGLSELEVKKRFIEKGYRIVEE